MLADLTPLEEMAVVAVAWEGASTLDRNEEVLLGCGRPPARVIADPVRRIGDHQVRLRSHQRWHNIGGAGAVAAANPVVPQQPNVAAASDRLIGYLRNAVTAVRYIFCRTQRTALIPLGLGLLGNDPDTSGGSMPCAITIAFFISC